jgi:hypothetical protein
LSFFFFGHQGLGTHSIPAFGSNYGHVMGSTVFNYAFIAVIPSWVNEKRPDVSGIFFLLRCCCRDSVVGNEKGHGVSSSMWSVVCVCVCVCVWRGWVVCVCERKLRQARMCRDPPSPACVCVCVWVCVRVWVVIVRGSMRSDCRLVVCGG